MNAAHPDHERYIIRALKDGEHALLKEIYQKFEPQIVQWVQNNSGSYTDGKDLFQDAMEVVMHKAFKADFLLTCPFGAFVYQISRNKWLDKLKQKKREAKVRLQELERYNNIRQAIPLASAAILEQSCHELMEESFSKLSDLCQRLLNLLKQNMAPDAIAAQLEMSNANTVYRRKFACMKSWRNFAKASIHFEACQSII